MTIKRRQKTSTFEAKSDYLKVVLSVTGNRRDALENKSSILLASNAVILSAVVGFGIPAINNINSLGTVNWIRIILLIGTLISLIASVLSAASVLIPMRTFKQRSKLLDVTKDEHNLFYFGKIAELTKPTYIQEIDNLTNDEILIQYTSEIHNSSKIVSMRYSFLSFSQKSFVSSVILFALFSISKLFP